MGARRPGLLSQQPATAATASSCTVASLTRVARIHAAEMIGALPQIWDASTGGAKRTTTA
jgi:hypothetical protein